MEFRRLGSTDIEVSVVGFGGWPIGGMSHPGVNDADSLGTLDACRHLGINFIDTAYNYGLEGESETLIGRFLIGQRGQFVLATKGGIHWEPPRKAIFDARPATLKARCETSLKRLGTDYVDLYYLHAPDPQVPIGESAGALAELLRSGKTRAVGASNMTVAQLEQFAAACPLAAVQPPYNLLERQIEDEILPWCRERGVAVVTYWPLMKGLLAGKMKRDHVLPEGDSRRKYPAFQGDEWDKNQDLLDELRAVARQAGCTVAQLAVRWALDQPGVTAALCGAKRPEQIRDNAGAGDLQLTAAQHALIRAALAQRGTPLRRSAV